ncbi:arginine--tRNA ligase [Clostridia bacterium]|nr:arginine--tRNA ligase [Clostridia bacterium]
MNYIEIAKEQLKNLLENKFKEEFDIVNPEFTIEIPADRENGDFATNIALVSAKILRQSPKIIAEKLIENISLQDTYFDSVKIGGAGFINFYISINWYADVLKNIAKEKSNFGRTRLGWKENSQKRILVEFVSANPTGPMHIGNARGGAIGDCLSSVLEWAGYYVEREFYINDAGNQIEKFAVSLEARYLQIYDKSVEIPEDAYQGADIIEHAENFAKIHADKFVNAESIVRKNALVEYALPLNINALESDLKKYRIEYDTWFRESTLHNNGAALDIVKQLTDKGYTYEQDGAVWFKASEFGSDKDYVLVRANGIPTYVVADIAYHYDKIVTRNFDKAINIWGADHHGYIPRLKAALTALGVDSDKLDVVLMQMVRLIRNGETAKLSKRSGKAITLVTLLDDIPIDAARFFFNLREPNSQFEFDLDLAIEQSASNPVFYVQYAHARICSLLKLLEIDKYSPNYDNLTLLCETQETALIQQLAKLPEEIEIAAKLYAPSKITKYALDTAALFHKFYDSCSIRNAENDQIKGARLALCESTKIVLENTLSILKVDAPDKM